MREDIIFILPNSTNTQTVKEVLRDNQLSIPIYESFMDDAVALAREKIAQGTKVIISRGNSIPLLKAAFTVPIVEIRYSFLDFALAVQKAMQKSQHIALVGYNDSYNCTELLQFFHPEQLELCVLRDPKKTHERLVELQYRGIDLIIAGQRIMYEAQQLGLQTVPIRMGRTNIQNALSDAQYLRNLEVEKSKQFEGIASLLDESQDGILSIDSQGIIREANRSGQKLLRLNDHAPFGSIYDFLPHQRIRQILQGFPLYNEIFSIHHENILLSGTATHLDDQVIGAILTIQSATDIQQKEYEIRRKNKLAGHCAKYSFDQIIGNSPAIVQAKEQAQLFAATDSNILISGPTGAGKELFAQGIHNASRRRSRPFVAINCAALPESVLESELFGYVKGAFTGARPEGKIGIFEQAHTGTIFLDEISEISLPVQARLLRVIQEREITRIGDDRTIPIDVRIIASTNRDLLSEIRNKQFREDLYYRLCVLNLILPSLNERKEDIPLLANHFLLRFSSRADMPLTIDEDALQMLRQMSWPGNIRQLQNTMECAAALCKGQPLTRAFMESILHISSRSPIRPPEAAADKPDPAPSRSSGDILAVLRACGGNKAQAAKRLGISYTTLWRRLKEMEPSSVTPR